MKMLTAGSWTMAFLMCLMSGFAYAQPGETIQPGDMVYIEVQRAPEISSSIRVDPQGNIRLPYVGAVKVAGMSESQAAGVVAQALEKVLRNPRVTVSRSQYKGDAAGSEFNTGRTAEMLLEIIPLNNSNAESMYGVLRGMNSSGGNVSFDPATNSLIITDTPAALQNMRSAIRQLDEMQSQLTQVRIEAKIAEVRVGAMKELGVRWFAQGDHLSGGYIPAPRQTVSGNQYRGGLSPSANEALGGGGDSGGGGGGRQFVSDPLTQRFNIPAAVAVPGQAFLGYVNSGIDLGVMLDMLVAEDQAEMLANPMTVTVNHQKAHIEMVDKIPYTEFGTEISGASSFSTEFLDAGITLDVTPHVHQDANGPYVKLELKPEVSFPSGSNNGTPILSIRRSETIANVRNNQTLVVGGIMSEDQRDVVTKLPWLGDLPIIGVLFRHKEKEKARTELMIFVTPTIYQRPEDITWDRMIDTSEHLRDADIAPLAELTGQGDKE
jgi:type IV pilus assembly protein PilQ